MSINDKREYVLVSVKWSRGEGYLLFWGSLSNDTENRSYSGYTMDLDTCEKYTIEEIREECLPIWKGQSFYELVKEDSNGTWAVKINDLHNLGQKKTIIWR